MPGQNNDFTGKALSANKINLIFVWFYILLLSASTALIVFLADSYRKDASFLIKAEARLKEKKEQYNNLDQLLKKYAKEKKEFEKHLFSDRDIATFLNEISAFAKEANVEITNIKSTRKTEVPSESEKLLKEKAAKKGERGEQEEEPGLLMFPMDISVEGNFHALLSFLAKIEDYRQLLTMSNFKMNLSTKGYPLLETSFLLRLYSINKTSISEKDN